VFSRGHQVGVTAQTDACFGLVVTRDPRAFRPVLRNEIDNLALLRRVRRTRPSASMDILAGMFAYLAGLGALFGAVALSLVFFSSTSNKLAGPRQPQGVTAMMVAPGASGKTPAAVAKPTVKLQKHRRPAATPVEPPRSTTAAHDTQAHDTRQRSAMSAVKWPRVAQEERARRWAYQQDTKPPSFRSRFLGYAE
jgi:hypothetical protein